MHYPIFRLTTRLVSHKSPSSPLHHRSDPGSSLAVTNLRGDFFKQVNTPAKLTSDFLQEGFTHRPHPQSTLLYSGNPTKHSPLLWKTSFTIFSVWCILYCLELYSVFSCPLPHPQINLKPTEAQQWNVTELEVDRSGVCDLGQATQPLCAHFLIFKVKTAIPTSEINTFTPLAECLT